MLIASCKGVVPERPAPTMNTGLILGFEPSGIGRQLNMNQVSKERKMLSQRSGRNSDRCQIVEDRNLRVFGLASYLITPRSDDSINRISISTSSPRSDSDLSFSRACEVFILEARRI